MRRDVTKGDLPALILAVLADSACHGYGIARRIEQQSAQALQMKEGSLYPALRILEQDGLIAGEWEVQPSGPARKVYRITANGLLQLKEKQQEWEQYARTMSAILGRKTDAQPA
ncbi:MAG: DNA-binding protein [Chthonomonadales bacterium]|nr:DNA-binding protein [Chthonomonadales bacterium]